jgi:hypothetical protein
MYIGSVFLPKTSATMTVCLLALATLGDVTKKRNDLISVVPPKVAKAISHVSMSLVL